MRVAILDYGSGNLRSAEKAFERAAREHDIRVEIRVTDDPQIVRVCDRIVLPGVGAFADCKRGLERVPGLREALMEAVEQKGRPFLGICVGMQLMADFGREYEVAEGFGWISGDVVRLEPSDPDLKIPHMGWNTLRVLSDHALLKGIETGNDGLHAYFVHSYHLGAKNRSDVVAEADYGGPVTAIVAHENRAGPSSIPKRARSLAWR